MDVKKLARKTKGPAGLSHAVGEADDRTWFEVDPDEFYPAAIAAAREIRDGGTPGYQHPWYLQAVVTEIRDLPVDALDLAERPVDAVEGVDARARRAAGLEAARRLFTARLHHEHAEGAPLGIRIGRSERWRL